MKPVGHAVMGLVFATVVRLALGQTIPSIGIFVAAIISAVLDLDRTEEPPHNTPFGHSIMMVAVWNAIGVGIVLFFQNYLDMVDIILGLTIGLWGHILMDIVYRETVYTIPTAASFSKVRSAVPIGADFENLHDGGLAVSAPWATFQRLSGGELAWPYWGRLK